MSSLFETLPQEIQDLVVGFLETPTVFLPVSLFRHTLRFSQVSKFWTNRIKEIIRKSLQNRRLGAFSLYLDKGCLAVVDLDTTDCLRRFTMAQLADKLRSQVTTLDAKTIHALYLGAPRAHPRRYLHATADGRLLLQVFDGPATTPVAHAVCWRASFRESLDIALVHAGPLPHASRIRHAVVSERGNRITIFCADVKKLGFTEYRLTSLQRGVPSEFLSYQHRDIHTDTINTLLFSKRDERYLLAPADDYRVSIYDRDTEKVDYITGHSSFVLSVDMTADDQFVVTGAYDHCVRVFDFASRQLLHVLGGFTDIVWHLSTTFYNEAPVVLVTCHDQAVAWNLATFEKLFQVTKNSYVKQMIPPLGHEEARGVKEREEWLFVAKTNDSVNSVSHVERFKVTEPAQFKTRQLIFNAYVAV